MLWNIDNARERQLHFDSAKGRAIPTVQVILPPLNWSTLNHRYPAQRTGPDIRWDVTRSNSRLLEVSLRV